MPLYPRRTQLVEMRRCAVMPAALGWHAILMVMMMMQPAAMQHGGPAAPHARMHACTYMCTIYSSSQS